MSKKLYVLDITAYALASAQVAKLPKQQKQILAAMVDQPPSTGTEIVARAIEAGLETRQRMDVLYAWYARSNEKVGVRLAGQLVVTPAEINDVDANGVELT